MQKQFNWNKITFITGIVLFVLGTLDPLEGAPLIFTGSLLITISYFIKGNMRWKIFAATSTAIALGVFFLFFFSNLGGWGGHSKLSWWWALLVLPYPAGWLLNVILFISTAIRPRKTPEIK